MRASIKWVLLGIVFIGALLLYQRYNPMEAAFFPACPFKSITGLECPGCGSQRAIHHLLNLEIGKAFQYNALLILAIPYILLGAIFDRISAPSDKVLKWRKRLYGTKAIGVVLASIIAFWVGRIFLF